MNDARIAQFRDWVRIHGRASNPVEECLDEIEALQRLLRQCKLLAMKDDDEDSTVREMHAVPLEQIPDFVNSRIAELECQAASVESLQAELDAANVDPEDVVITPPPIESRRFKLVPIDDEAKETADGN